jgi:hypothetical protein
VKHSVAVLLLHLGVDVETTTAQLGDFFRQQLDAVHAVAVDN